MPTSKLDTILSDFESFLSNHTPPAQSFHPYFQTAVWEMMLSGGKRFRPALIFSVVDAYAPSLVQNAFLPALAMEVLHTFSLIHDDLPSIDNAPLRRNHPTLHTQYDEVGAILCGDFLNSYAFYLITQAPLSPQTRSDLIAVLSLNATQMILGEALDCYFEDQKLELHKLQSIHKLKTAKLIAASLKIGGVIAYLPQQDLESLWELGEAIGLFFQIRDDIIDATHSPEEAGKPTRHDMHKNSYVNLLGLHQAKNELESHKEKIQISLSGFENPKLQSHLLSLLGF